MDTSFSIYKETLHGSKSNSHDETNDIMDSAHLYYFIEQTNIYEE